jgi:hypothetical protein
LVPVPILCLGGHARDDPSADLLAYPNWGRTLAYRPRVGDRYGSPLMKGWILVAPEGLKTTRQLGTWVTSGVRLASSLPPRG